MDSNCYRILPEGLEVSVKATPKAKQNKIVGFTPQGLKIQVTAAPENGKANEAIITLLAKYCGLAKQDVALISGETSPHKKIFLRGNPGELLGILQ